MAAGSPAQIQKNLKGMDSPASKQDLLEHAKQQGADEDVCATLEQLPEQQYGNAADVSKAIGEVEEKLRISSER